MTTFEHIIHAISEFGYPYVPDLYKGPAERFFTYNYADDRGVLYADDQPVATVASVQIHFTLPKNIDFISIKNRIRRRILEEGFTYPEITVLIEEDKRHIIFECDIEEEMEE